MFKFNLKKILAGTGIPVCAIYVGNSADLLLLLLRWYHGRLDRFQSEERLRQAEQHGSYLVRESDRQDAHTHNLGSILATRPNNQCCRAATIFGGSGPGSARSGSRRRLWPDGVGSGQKRAVPAGGSGFITDTKIFQFDLSNFGWFNCLDEK